MPSDVSVTAIIAARNEADVIRQVTADLARQGIGVYLIDDGSTDATVEEARAGAGAAWIGLEAAPPSSGYAWEDLLRRKAALAQELPGDWFLHHDADELRESPWRDRSLREGLALVDRLGWNAVDFAVFNFPPVRETFDGSDLRAAFPFWEPAPLHDRVQVKAWKRTAAPVELAASGGHEARFDGRRVFPVRFVLRHYPVRDQAHGTRKVFEDRRPRFRPEEQARGWHVQYAGFAPGHRFVRDPATLRPWDDDAVRVELALRHRGVDDLEERLATSQAEVERLTRDVANYTRDLAWHRDEVGRLGRALAEVDARAARVSDDLDAARREVAALHPRLDGAQREVVALHAQLDAARREAADLHGRLDTALREAEHLRERSAAAAAELNRLLAEHHRLVTEADALRRTLAAVETQARTTREHLDSVLSSRTWRWTAPVRKLL